MPSKYTFFDFIETELNLENHDDKLSYDILSTIEKMYNNPLLQESIVKKLIAKSKNLHTNISLIVQPIHSLDTGAEWDILNKQIKIENPNSTLHGTNLEESIYIFARNLFFELCNSINLYFSKQNVGSLIIAGIQSPDMFAFLKELAEYPTALECSKILQQFKIDSNEITNIFTETEQTLLKIFNSYYSLFDILELDSFLEYWQYMSSVKKGHVYRDLAHTSVYINQGILLIEKLQNIKLSELNIEDSEEEIDQYEEQLNKIYDEVAAELKNGTFNLATIKEKYSTILIEAATDDQSNKTAYYSLYQIIFGDGCKCTSIKELSVFFNIGSIIVDVAQNKLNLNKVSKDEKTLIYLAFEIIKDFNQLNTIKDIIEVIANKYKEPLEQIKIRNSTLAEKYQNSLYALLDTTFLSHTLSDFIKQICQDLRYFSPEIIDLLHTANNLKSLWCHQKELVLFSYGNNETQTVHDDHYTPKENKSTPLIPKTWPLCICYK